MRAFRVCVPGRLLWAQDEMLGSFLQAWLLSHPMGDSFDLSSQAWCSALLTLLLQRDGWLHPTCTYSESRLWEPELETLAETEWSGSGVGATFPSMNSGPRDPQVKNLTSPILPIWSPCPIKLATCVHSQPRTNLQSFFGKLWRNNRQPQQKAK